jgi:hypothetical protein
MEVNSEDIASIFFIFGEIIFRVHIDNQKFPPGFYIVFSKDESIVDAILFGNVDSLMLNFSRYDAYKVSVYFKKEKLQWIPGIVTSHSEHPNNLLSSAIHLLRKTDCLIVGMAGLSHDSIIEIMEYFDKNMPSGKKLFFIDSTNDYLIDNPLIKVTEFNIKDIGIILKRTMFKCPFPKLSYTLYS